MNNHAPQLIIEGSALPEPFKDAFAYWQALRQPQWAPAWPSFQLDKLHPKLLPWAVVVDVLCEPRDFEYRYWGTSRGRLIGKEMTGLKASDIADAHMRAGNFEEYIAVCAAKKPLLCQTPVTMSAGRQVSFHSMRLPFRDHDERVSHIFSVVDYEEINADHYAYYGTRPTGL
ncbi:MAG: PAS domain-containing protein [Rhodospirillales bacterium]|nr:PAS domain-containing protein [Rhodospirillales bacterium]